MNNAFNGLGMGLATLSRLSNAQTRSISAENFTGAKGQGGMATEGTGADAGRELGQGWKLSPSIHKPFPSARLPPKMGHHRKKARHDPTRAYRHRHRL